MRLREANLHSDVVLFRFVRPQIFIVPRARSVGIQVSTQSTSLLATPCHEGFLLSGLRKVLAWLEALQKPFVDL